MHLAERTNALTWGAAILLAGAALRCGTDAQPIQDMDDAEPTDAGDDADLDLEGPDLDADSDAPIDSGPDAARRDAAAEPDGEPLPRNEGVVLEIAALDIWGRTLEEPYIFWSTPQQAATPVREGPTFSRRLTEPGRYSVRVVAPDHYDLELRWDFDGRAEVDAVTLVRDALSGHEGVAVHRAIEVTEGVEDAVVQIYLGLRHRWFASSGPPPRRGNSVRLLMDGEEAWGFAAERLAEATDTVHIGTWWWISNFELVRPEGRHITMSEEERRENTIYSILDGLPATTTIRVLVWQDNLAPALTVDDPLVERGRDPDDGFEFMGMTNSTEGVFDWQVPPAPFGERVATNFDVSLESLDDEARVASIIPGRQVDLTDWPLGIEASIQIASWHQKFLVIDGDEAFVGGMNYHTTDWDTSEHLVFEPRRMNFEASTSDRQAVADHAELPDNIPRKDYMVYLLGPAVGDVQDVFSRRWHHQIDIGRRYSENATPFEVARDQKPDPDDVQVQVTATMPPGPIQENSILESQVSAIRNAERFIFIEDQYWRAPLLTEALVERMEAVDDLILVVISKPVSEWTNVACYWTHVTDEELQSRFPTRYFTFQLRSFDYVETWGWDETESRFVDIDTHSKLLIVDDRYVSIGSCNKNNRGLIYEGELNLAILDDEIARSWRLRILENILGFTPASDEPTDWVDDMLLAASANRAVYNRWADEGFDISLDGEPLPDKFIPHSFIYPLTFDDPSDCLIEGIGPDQTK